MLSCKMIPLFRIKNTTKFLVKPFFCGCLHRGCQPKEMPTIVIIRKTIAEGIRLMVKIRNIVISFWFFFTTEGG